MRHLSLPEKQWVKQIVDGFNSTSTGYVATTILWKYLLGDGNEVDLDFKESEILFYRINGKDVLIKNESGAPSPDPSFDHHDAIDINRIVTQIAVLFKLLLDEGYVYLVKESISKASTHYLSDDTKQRPIPLSSKFDNDLMKVLKDFHNHVLICNQSLIEYVENGYIEYEEKIHLDKLASSERQAKDNLKSAYRVGFLSPIIAGLFGLITAWLIPITLNKNQVDEFNQNVEKQIETLDSLKQVLNNSDSISITNLTEELDKIRECLQPLSGDTKQISKSINSLKDKN